MKFRWLLLCLFVLTASVVYRAKVRSTHTSNDSMASGEFKAQSVSVKSETWTVSETPLSEKKEVSPVSQSGSSEPNAQYETPKEILRDFSDLAQQSGDEKSFLLNEIKLTDEQYLAFVEHQRETDQKLREVESWAQAFGVNVEEAKKPILKGHIQWMQSFIGVGNYARLQEMTLSQFNF